MNVQERIEALEAEFNERLNALKAEMQREEEFPQNGDEYWYIDTTGDIYNENWECFGFEKATLEIGNVYKTRKEAEFAVEKLKVEAELRKFSRPFESGEDNYHIIFNTDGEFTGIFSALYRQSQGIIYFESLEKAQQAMSTVGEDRIKKYIFGVED